MEQCYAIGWCCATEGGQGCAMGWGWGSALGWGQGCPMGQCSGMGSGLCHGAVPWDGDGAVLWDRDKAVPGDGAVLWVRDGAALRTATPLTRGALGTEGTPHGVSTITVLCPIRLKVALAKRTGRPESELMALEDGRRRRSSRLCEEPGLELEEEEEGRGRRSRRDEEVMWALGERFGMGCGGVSGSPPRS